MRNKPIQFIDLFFTLSAKEKKEFKTHSKLLYAKEEKPMQLLTLLYQLKSPFFDRNKVFKKLYGDREGNIPTAKYMKRGSNELSKLLRWLEDFLILQRIRSKQHKTEYFRISRDIYRERGLDHYFYKQADKLDTHLNQAPQSTGQLYQFVENYATRYYYSPTQKLLKDEYSILQAAHYLSLYYIAQKAKFDCELKSRISILGPQNNKETTFPSPTNYPCIQLHQNLVQLIEKPNTNTFKIAFNFFQQLDHERFAPKELLAALLYLINFVAKNENQNIAMRQIFDLYKIGIQKNLLIENQKLSEELYQNIINTACAIGEVEFATNFVANNSKYLASEVRFTLKALSIARIEFENKNFEQVIQHLITVKPNTIAQNLQARLLQIRSYFELASANLPYGSSLYDAVDSLKSYLHYNRNKLHPEKIEGFKNFCSILKQFLKTPNKKDLIINKINQENNLVCRSWLLKKLGALGN